MPSYKFRSPSGKVVTPAGVELIYSGSVLTLPENSKYISYLEELLEEGVCTSAEALEVAPVVERVAQAAVVGLTSSTKGVTKISVSKVNR